MRVLVDNQLPASLVRWFEKHDCVAEHVLEIGHGQSADEIIWRYAAGIGAVIISKDEDFARLTATRPEAVSVVWVRIGNCRTVELIKLLDRMWPSIVEQIEAGAKLVEVL